MKKENIIKCNKGWEGLYKPILKMIYAHDDLQKTVDKKIGVLAVKSIDGELCIAMENNQNASNGLMADIIKARKESRDTCEFCGTKENVGITMNFEYVTCCEECWMNNIARINRQSAWKNLKTNKMTKMEL